MNYRWLNDSVHWDLVRANLRKSKPIVILDVGDWQSTLHNYIHTVDFSHSINLLQECARNKHVHVRGEETRTAAASPTCRIMRIIINIVLDVTRPLTWRKVWPLPVHPKDSKGLLKNQTRGPTSLTRLLHEKRRVEERQLVARVELQGAVEVPQGLGGVLHLDVDDGQVVPQVGVGAVQLQRPQVGVAGFRELVHLQEQLPSDANQIQERQLSHVT